MNSLVNIYLENRKKDKKAGRITATWVIETTELLLNIHGKEELKAAAAAKAATEDAAMNTAQESDVDLHAHQDKKLRTA